MCVYDNLVLSRSISGEVIFIPDIIQIIRQGTIFSRLMAIKKEEKGKRNLQNCFITPWLARPEEDCCDILRTTNALQGKVASDRDLFPAGSASPEAREGFVFEKN